MTLAFTFFSLINFNNNAHCAEYQWIELPDMNFTRSAEGVLLKDGRVLLVGGQTQHDMFSDLYTIAEAEIFDPKTRSFTLTGKLNVKRCSPGLTVLNDGKVLVIGGSGGSLDPAFSSMELYDPETGIFTLIGNMSISRIYTPHGVLLPNGEVLIMGGTYEGMYANTTNVIDKYIPSTGQIIKNFDRLLMPRGSKSPKVRLHNGEIIVVGGSKYGPPIIEMYNPDTMQSSTPTMEPAGGEGSYSVAYLANGKLLIKNHLETYPEYYYPEFKTFEQISNIGAFSINPYREGIVLLSNNKVLFVGSQIQLFNPDNEEIEATIDWPVPGSYGIVPLNDNSVLFYSRSISNKSYLLTFSESYTLRRLSETKYYINNSENNDNSWVNNKEDEASGDLITHALYPFQLHEMSGDYDGYKFSNNRIEFVRSVNKEEEDNRQPLILIHGWQADRDPEALFEGLLPLPGVYKNRDPQELAKHPDDNYYDAEGYWWSFLRFIETNQELKNKYKIYLYQYPSYKHITFNARMFSNMLYDVKYIRDYLNNGGKISILAHSMGGLVARSFLEEHGGIWFRDDAGWKLFKSGEMLLDKLITLDTPHHGSPAAVYPWMDVVDNVGKDLYSPGALDVWWDGYDGAFSVIDSSDLAACVTDKDWENSWRPTGDTSWFDAYYRLELLLDGNDVSEIREGIILSENCTVNTVTIRGVDVNFYLKPNPWLTHLNALHKKGSWKEKYIFYGGYNDSSDQHFDNKLEDEDSYDYGDNAWITGVWVAGYLNDSPVPVTSSFFDSAKEDCFKNTDSCPSQVDLSQWPAHPLNKVGMFWSELVWDKTKNILITDNEGYKIRFFKDYHHNRMLNGAYYHSRGGYIPDYASNDNWAYDLITNTSLRPPFSKDDCPSDRFYTAFRSSLIRSNYIQQTGIPNVDFLSCEVMCDNTTVDDNWTNTLEFEPLYILLAKDLMDKYGDMNNDKAIDLADMIRALQIVSGNNMAESSLDSDINFDGKLGIEEAIWILNELKE